MRKNNKVGLFIDLANLNRSMQENGQKPDYKFLLTKASEYGAVIEARGYGDFSRIPAYIQKEIISVGIRLIHCPNNHNGDTKLDDPLMIEDIHDCLTQTRVGIFILVTGDSHFAPLVSTLRRNLKKVVVIGVPSTTSSILRECANEFIPLLVNNNQENKEQMNYPIESIN